MQEFINVNELQNETPKVLKGLEEGKKFVLLRYSKPAGVLIGYEEYQRLINDLSGHIEECKKCIKDFKEETNEKLS
jgi:antitoxin (DNA-binding transcriptional repressor) of toxin-antitoxin stability system